MTTNDNDNQDIVVFCRHCHHTNTTREAGVEGDVMNDINFFRLWKPSQSMRVQILATIIQNHHRLRERPRAENEAGRMSNTGIRLFCAVLVRHEVPRDPSFLGCVYFDSTTVTTGLTTECLRVPIGSCACLKESERKEKQQITKGNYMSSSARSSDDSDWWQTLTVNGAQCLQRRWRIGN